MKILDNYRQLVNKIDDLCRGIEQRFAGHLACRKGCDDCCRHLRLFPVEGSALAEAMRALPRPKRDRIRQRAQKAGADAPCPLLDDGACLLYHARPIICRTHGLPVLTDDGQVDFCPRNFQGISQLSGDAILNLERLNAALAGVNALFVRELSSRLPEDLQVPQRLSVAEALQPPLARILSSL